MKTVAYLRVSTTRQDVQGQRLAILEYARRHSLRIDEFIEATASARTSAKRRRLDDLMGTLEPGDRLVVSELSRLGRSLGQIVAMLDTLAREGIAFVAIKEQIRIEGKQDIQTKVMTTLFALFAEVERDLISERTREGLAKARSSGKKLGRPKDRWVSHASTARRMKSVTSCGLGCPRTPSPRSPASPGRPCITSSTPGVCSLVLRRAFTRESSRTCVPAPALRVQPGIKLRIPRRRVRTAGLSGPGGRRRPAAPAQMPSSAGKPVPAPHGL